MIREAAIQSVHYVESLHSDPSVEQYADAVLACVTEVLIDSMTPPIGGPDDAFWRGAQWAYGQVRDTLGESGVVPATD